MSTASAEAFIVDRYKLWQRWRPQYDYKHAKGARIAEIVAETGGPVPRALEIGVGPGGVAAALSRRGMKIIGVDLSPDALRRAQEYCRHDNVALMRASGFSLPFAAGTLPLVYASQVLHLFDHDGRLALLREVRRVLQPGGRVVFDMKNAWSHPVRYLTSSAARRRQNFPRQSDIIALLHAAGFADIRRRPGIPPVLHRGRLPNNPVCRRLAHTTFFIASA